ncbi:glycosyltransferase family 1 protein [Candidatus Woesearchaeota archaeon]|nr:MAG: glycosyltransferase family 1 protein [Candidatus Woesearchaeota archaeon]
MKICIISPNFLEPTAWMVSAYKTAILLKRAGIDVVVLTTRTKGSRESEVIEGVRVRRMPSIFISDPFNFTIPIGLRKSVNEIIDEEKPDAFIINKYMFYTSLAGPYLKKKKEKVIVQTDTFPGIIWFAPSRLLNAGMWVYARTLGKRVLRKSDRVVLLHEGLVKTAKKLGLRYEVIHNGVDFRKYKEAKPAEDILKMKGNKKLVTYVGRLDEVKGYRLILEASKKIGRQRKDIMFLMVVGDKHPEKRKKISREYPNVILTGFRKDIENVWAASDIGVLSSHAEGLPNTVMEAMAAGTPVIASRVGGVPAIIDHGKNGFLFERGNAEEMTRRIEELADNENLRRKMGQNARKKIREEFNLEKLADRWKKLLKEVTKGEE